MGTLSWESLAAELLMWALACFGATQPACVMGDPRQLPSTARRLAVGETSLVLEGNGVQPR